MPRAGLEPTITASERAKTVHALDRSATVTGQEDIWGNRIIAQCIHNPGTERG
jgi:hypothetical protein